MKKIVLLAIVVGGIFHHGRPGIGTGNSIWISAVMVRDAIAIMTAHVTGTTTAAVTERGSSTATAESAGAYCPNNARFRTFNGCQNGWTVQDGLSQTVPGLLSRSSRADVPDREDVGRRPGLRCRRHLPDPRRGRLESLSRVARCSPKPMNPRSPTGNDDIIFLVPYFPMKYFYYRRLSQGRPERGAKPGIPSPIIHAAPLATFDLSPSICRMGCCRPLPKDFGYELQIFSVTRIACTCNTCNSGLPR